MRKIKLNSFRGLTTRWNCFWRLLFWQHQQVISFWWFYLRFRSARFRWVSLDRFHCHTTKKTKSKPCNEIAQTWNVIGDTFINHLTSSQVCAVHRFWVIYRSVSRNFIEYCMEPPYWCTTGVHQHGGQKSTRTSGIYLAMEALTFRS